MSSMRGAYKAKLREGSNSSIASRRKSKGAERKNSRYEEINKRRLISNMSPVAEPLDDAESSQNVKNKHMRVRDANRKRGDDTVLDRLKQWREEKKRQMEQEKHTTKVKPMFKAGGGLDRKSETGLFEGKMVLSKPKENKAPLRKAVPVIKKEQKINVSVDIGCKIPNNSTKTMCRSKTEKQTSTLEVKRSVPSKNQPSKMKDPIPTGTSKLLRAKKSSVGLASKLTVAAAAKRNDLNASPKKFLRATRATTLQKKELLDNKKGLKMTKGLSKSTGKLLGQQKRNDVSVTDASCHKEVIDFKPLVVPKVLESFDFSALDNAVVNDKESITCSAQDHEMSNVLENNETFTKMQLKSKRKSVRKSSRLAALEMNEETAIQSVPANECCNLKSKRKSIRKSTQLTSLRIDNVDDTAIVSVPENESSEHIKSKRKSTRVSKRLTHLETNGINNTGILSVPHNESSDDLITFTPRLSKSVRKSKRFSSSVAKQRKCPIELDLSGKDHSTHNFVSLTPKLSKRKSIRASATTELEALQICTPNKDIFNVIDPPNSSNVASNESPLTVSPKNLQKSSALDAAENKPKDYYGVISGNELSTEEDMEVCAVQGTVSDMDTQIPLIDVTSTPISTHRSRKSMKMDSLSASSVEIASSPEKIPTPKSNSRRSRGARRSLSMKRRSRMSSATPAKTPRFDGKDLNVSGGATPNSVRNIENIPRRRSTTSRRSARKSTVISVSDEGTAVGRDLELALAYKVEKPPLSAKASRILKELVIEKVEGERSFFEVSFDESSREGRNTSVNCPDSKLDNTSGNDKMQSISTASFTPRRSDEITVSTNGSNSLTTPKSVSRTRHSLISSGFKEPGLPLSAVRSLSHRRCRTESSTPSKTPEQMIKILKKSPMVEMARRRSRHVSSPAPPKGQYFRDLVHNETQRLTELCNKWNSFIMGVPDLGEEVLGDIRSTVGKALLLIEQRFKQFTGLVDNYVYDLGEKETTPTDLQGFWDMIYFQVEDVDSQFKQLEVLKQSNWQLKTDSPKVKVGLKKKAVPKGKVKSKGVKSNFAAFRAEMLKKKAAQGKTDFQAADEDSVETVISC